MLNFPVKNKHLKENVLGFNNIFKGNGLDFFHYNEYLIQHMNVCFKKSLISKYSVYYSFFFLSSVLMKCLQLQMQSNSCVFIDSNKFSLVFVWWFPFIFNSNLINFDANGYLKEIYKNGKRTYLQ